MKNFEDYEFNQSYCYKDNDAFINKTSEICYIPENAESLEDAFSYNDLKDLVIVWLKDNPNYIKEHETDLDNILLNMFDSLSWEFPSTFLDQLDY